MQEELPSTGHTVMTIVDSDRLKEGLAAIEATTTKYRPGRVIAVSSMKIWYTCNTASNTNAADSRSHF
jgi:hypothetical protein